jgi:hypothetical protein
MNILQSWKESLMVLAPKNIKLFLLVTLKTLFDSINPIIFFYAASFIFLGIGFATGLTLLFSVISLVSIFLITLSVRPSTLIKDMEYYLSDIFFIGSIVLFVLTVWSIGISSLSNKFGAIGYWTGLFFVPYGIIFLFFVMDANKKTSDLLRAPLRAFSMVVLTLPFYSIIALLFISIFMLIEHVIGENQIIIRTFLFVITIPFFITLLSRLYILHIHRHYQDYFGRCW